jgi:glutathione S-transferase
MGFFRQFAGVLDSHLKGRKYLVGVGLTIADFAVGSLLSHARDAKLPSDEFAEISRWYAQLEEIPGWREPFPRQEANAA